ncbi:MAG: hypothetical protein ABJN65_08060 [Parasphingorhabdus sp.]
MPDAAFDICALRRGQYVRLISDRTRTANGLWALDDQSFVATSRVLEGVG